MRQIVFLSFALACAAAGSFAYRQSEPAAAPPKIDFAKDVQPIFNRSCGMSHGPNTQMAGLRLDAKQSVLAKSIKRGLTIGESDDLGFNIINDKVHVHDLHATILKLLGFEHTHFTYKFQGRNFRLTGVAGSVVDKICA